MDLQTQLELTAKDADAIVKYRTDHGDFKDWDGLAKVPGIDTAKLTAKKDSIVFTTRSSVSMTRRDALKAGALRQL